MINIIDCIILNNDNIIMLDLLLQRLKITEQYIDKFIIIESVNNNESSLYLANIDQFIPFIDKIIYCSIELPTIDIEKTVYHINYFKHEINKLTYLKNEDIIIISDLEYCLDPEILIRIKTDDLKIENSIYDFNNQKSKLFNYIVYIYLVMNNSIELSRIKNEQIFIEGHLLNRHI